MASADYNFDRIVKLYFVAKTADGVSSTAKIVFDPLSDRELCPRIDFWVQGKGTEFTGTGDYFKTARIDLYNIGPALNKVLSVYETVVKGVWNIGTADVQVTLEVGYRNQGLTAIFNGHVGSYNVERIQTESTVDNVWHLYCQSTFSGPAEIIDEDDKAISTDDFLEPGFSKPNSIGMDVEITGDQAIRSAFIAYPRNISVWNGGLTEEDSYWSTETTKLTEKEFDEYCEILYVKSDLVTRDYDLENNFKNNKNYVVQPIPEQLDDAIRMITKRLGNYSFKIEIPESNSGKYQIKIFKQTISSVAKIRHGRDWIIKNFENLTKAPTVSGGTMQFTMIMEPSMRTLDTIELQIDESFNKTLSFEFNFGGGGVGAQTLFAGSNVIGLAQSAKRTQQIGDAEARGNIFYRRYCVLFIEHQGSTHTNTWTTQACCSCTEE